jgi:nicotinate-nucleotide adenylyltransferase
LGFEPSTLNEKKRIAIFGGSYNPVHNAHVQVGSYVAEHENMDEVWVMLSPQNPFKNGRFMLPDDSRLQLLKDSFAGVKNLKVSDYELYLPKPSYTSRTLDKLMEEHPDCEFSLVFGIDILDTLLEWRNAVKIIEQHKLLAYLRPGYEDNLDKVLSKLERGYEDRKSPQAPSLFDQLKIINGPLVDISSTEIWEQVKQKQDVAHLVPETVNRYLRERYY